MTVVGMVTDFTYAIIYQVLFHGPNIWGYSDKQNRHGLILLAHFTVQTNCPLRLKDVSFPPLEIKDRAKNPN